MSGDPLSPKSAALQHLRRLSGRRRARAEANEFVIDGPTLITEALASGIDIGAVYAEPDADPHVVAVAEEAGIGVSAVRPGALAKVTSPVSPQRIAALAAIPPAATLAEVSGFLLVLVEVADPGNAGTLFRSAEAAGVAGIVCCGQVVDVWSPKCVRASAGSVFRVPVAREPSIEQAMAAMTSQGVRTVAADASGAPFTESDLAGNVAVLLGNEAHGLAPTVVTACEHVVRVPMEGRVESLNVATVGTLIAFEAARQRAGRGAGP